MTKKFVLETPSYNEDTYGVVFPRFQEEVVNQLKEINEYLMEHFHAFAVESELIEDNSAVKTYRYYVYDDQAHIIGEANLYVTDTGEHLIFDLDTEFSQYGKM